MNTKRIVQILGLIIALIVVVVVVMGAVGLSTKPAAKAEESAPIKIIRTEKGCLEGKQIIRVFAALPNTNSGHYLLWNTDMQGRPILCGGEPLDLRQKGQ